MLDECDDEDVAFIPFVVDVLLLGDVNDATMGLINAEVKLEESKAEVGKDGVGPEKTEVVLCGPEVVV